MKIVIDISEKQYEIAKEYVETVDDKSSLAKAIVNGTVLPKGHGKIIDVGTIDLNQDEFISQSDYYTAECAIENAITIVEADKAESEDKE